MQRTCFTGNALGLKFKELAFVMTNGDHLHATHHLASIIVYNTIGCTSSLLRG
jgi:hypothetical protein